MGPAMLVEHARPVAFPRTGNGSPSPLRCRPDAAAGRRGPDFALSACLQVDDQIGDHVVVLDELADRSTPDPEPRGAPAGTAGCPRCGDDRSSAPQKPQQNRLEILGQRLGFRAVLDSLPSELQSIAQPPMNGAELHAPRPAPAAGVLGHHGRLPVAVEPLFVTRPSTGNPDHSGSSAGTRLRRRPSRARRPRPAATHRPQSPDAHLGGRPRTGDGHAGTGEAQLDEPCPIDSATSDGTCSMTGRRSMIAGTKRTCQINRARGRRPTGPQLGCRRADPAAGAGQPAPQRLSLSWWSAMRPGAGRVEASGRDAQFHRQRPRDIRQCRTAPADS